MKVLISYLTLFFAVFALTPAFAEDITIEMLNKRDDGAKMVYSADIARVEVGTSITWIPTSKGHNVHFIAGPEGWELPKKSKNGKEVAITFDTPGVYLYVCTPHATMGMIGIVTVAQDGEVPMNDISKAKVRGKSKKKLKDLLGEL